MCHSNPIMMIVSSCRWVPFNSTQARSLKRIVHAKKRTTPRRLIVDKSLLERGQTFVRVSIGRPMAELAVRKTSNFFWSWVIPRPDNAVPVHCTTFLGILSWRASPVTHIERECVHKSHGACALSFTTYNQNLEMVEFSIVQLHLIFKMILECFGRGCAENGSNH